MFLVGLAIPFDLLLFFAILVRTFTKSNYWAVIKTALLSAVIYPLYLTLIFGDIRGQLFGMTVLAFAAGLSAGLVLCFASTAIFESREL